MSVQTNSGHPSHPAWCDHQHNPDYPVHSRDIGALDIELGEVDLSVSLHQGGTDPAVIWLCEHRRLDTAVTQLTRAQAQALGERLIAAADAVGSGVLVALRDEHTNSGPGGRCDTR